MSEYVEPRAVMTLSANDVLREANGMNATLTAGQVSSILDRIASADDDPVIETFADMIRYVIRREIEAELKEGKP